MTVNDLDDVVEERLTSDEWDEVLLTDLLVRGRVRHRPHKPEVWLVVEISAVMDREDVARALRRTELLRRAGLIALPAVAGKTATEGAQTQARTLGVAMLQDGTGWHWEETLAAWLS
jgi:hypothetical protein